MSTTRDEYSDAALLADDDRSMRSDDSDAESDSGLTADEVTLNKLNAQIQLCQQNNVSADDADYQELIRRAAQLQIAVSSRKKAQANPHSGGGGSPSPVLPIAPSKSPGAVAASGRAKSPGRARLSAAPAPAFPGAGAGAAPAPAAGAGGVQAAVQPEVIVDHYNPPDEEGEDEEDEEVVPGLPSYSYRWTRKRARGDRTAEEVRTRDRNLSARRRVDAAFKATQQAQDADTKRMPRFLRQELEKVLSSYALRTLWDAAPSSTARDAIFGGVQSTDRIMVLESLATFSGLVARRFKTAAEAEARHMAARYNADVMARRADELMRKAKRARRLVHEEADVWAD